MIYTSYIKQFWATTNVKTVNGDEQIQALMDKKKVIITEISVRSDLHLEDAKVKNLEDRVKFLMFPRFVQVFLDSQVERMLKHKVIYVTPSHTKNIFADMKRQGKYISGKVIPLFETMMVQPQEDMGEDSEIPNNYHHTPTVTPPSISYQSQQKQKFKKSKKRITEVPQLSGSTHIVADEHVTTTSNDPLLSGEDRLKLTELMELCTQLQSRFLPLETTKANHALEIRSLKRRAKKLEKKAIKKTHKIKRLYKIGVTLVDKTQGRNDQDMFDTSILNDEEVVAEKEVSTADPVPTAGEVVTTAGEVVTTAGVKDNTQAIMDAYYELAARLQEEKRGELTIEEKSRLFVELMDKRKKYFARLRAKKIKSKPPTKTQQRDQMCTYLKNMLVKGSEKAVKGSSKRAGDKLEQEDAKRLCSVKDALMSVKDILTVAVKEITQCNNYLFNKAEDPIKSFIKWYQSLVRSFDQQKNNIQAQQKKKMMKKSSSSENEPCCSKDCKKNTETLNKKITDLEDKLFDANNMIFHYKLGLSQKLKTLKEEKEGVYGKLVGLLTALKDLDNLIENQRSDKNKEGLGYSDVPPPIAQIYSSPKKDLSWIGLPEFADDTITDYSRPSPAIESTSDDAQNKNPSVSETVSSPITLKPFIKFGKLKDSHSKSKTGKTESPKKPPVKYVEQYRKPTKKPNVRGNQRNWNNLKTQQLGPDFIMKKKACFNSGDFNYLAYYCRKRVKKSFTSKLVAYRPPVRPVRTNMNGARLNRTSFNKQAHSYENRPFHKTSVGRSHYRALWIPTVNRNFPIVNKKLPTDISSPFEELSDIGSPRADDHEHLELPEMLEDPYVEVTLQAPPSPDYIPGPEEPEQAPPSPDYVSGPEHVDDEIVAEEQPYAKDASPTSQPPEYVPESDLEAHPEDDEDDDPEEDPVGESSSAVAARPARGLRADYNFVATIDREIMRDPEREIVISELLRADHRRSTEIIELRTALQR
nr:xylulose kinase-1 [Tanacetum cinerariifolium]